MDAGVIDGKGLPAVTNRQKRGRSQERRDRDNRRPDQDRNKKARGEEDRGRKEERGEDSRTSGQPGSVRSKQEQRRQTLEKGTSDNNRKATTREVRYVIDKDVSEKVLAGVAATRDNLRHGSKPLRDFLAFVEQDDICDLVVNVHAAEQTGHGNTGAYVRDPGSKDGWMLLQEAFLTRPDLILKPQGFRVEVNLTASQKAAEIDVSTTMLHELELHVAPAGQLLMNIERSGGEERLHLVLDHMRRADDHVDLDGQERYLRTAARIFLKSAKENTKWADDLFQSVDADARKQFAAYASDAKVSDELVKALEWLHNLPAAIMRRQDATATPGPKPTVTQPVNGRPNRSLKDIDPGEVLDHVAGLVEKRTAMLELFEDARTTLGIPLSVMINLYRKTVVPTLLRQCPDELHDPKQWLFFLRHNGIDATTSVDAVAKALKDKAFPDPELSMEIKSAWPPSEPLFWLTPEEEDSWTYRTGLPSAMKTATGLVHAQEVFIDGKKYKIAVTDEKLDKEGSRVRSFHQTTTNKWITMLPRS